MLKLSEKRCFHQKHFKKLEKPQADILTVYERLTGNTVYKKTGRAILCLCCFHEERRPSLALYPDTNSYHCFSCAANGDVYKFIMDYCHVEFKEALNIIKNL